MKFVGAGEFRVWFKEGVSNLLRSGSIPSKQRHPKLSLLCVLLWMLHGVKIFITDPFVQPVPNELCLCALLSTGLLRLKKILPYHQGSYNL